MTYNELEEAEVRKFESLVKQLHFAIQSYESAKEMNERNNLRPLEEKTWISTLTADGAIRHEQNIKDAYEKLEHAFRASLRTIRDATAKACEVEKKEIKCRMTCVVCDMEYEDCDCLCHRSDAGEWNAAVTAQRENYEKFKGE